MMRTFAFPMIMILLLGCGTSSSREEDPRLSSIDSLISLEYENRRFSGSVVIGSKDIILFQKHMGQASMVWNIPVRADTRFDIASVNKSFIAGLIMIAVQEKKIQLTNRLVDLLKRFDYKGMFDPDITIHHMLSHTSGLADYDGVAKAFSANEFQGLKRSRFSNSEYVNFISLIPSVSEPGELFYYSNFAYHLLCVILEEVYQKPFATILKEKISGPMNMVNTCSSSSNEEIIERLAEGYNYREDQGDWIRNDFIDLTLGRRIFSTALDLYQWARSMDNSPILNDTLISRMKANQVGTITQSISYGYGWVSFGPGDDFGMGNLHIDQPYIIHGGNTGGYKSMLVNINEGQHIISMLVNTGSRTNEMELTQKLVQILMEY